ncbi:MAG: hypothetical protein R2911_07935 [Caldilineaceae bacterium]
MINDGRRYFPDEWWVSTFPGMAIFAMVFSWNLLGDGVRDLLDPRGGVDVKQREISAG